VTLFWQNPDWLRSFLVIVKGCILSTILQDGFGARYPASRSAFRECAQQGVQRTWWWAVQKSRVQAKAFFRFDGWLSHQAANASCELQQHVLHVKIIRKCQI
jgi:hypothetical protein